MIKIREISGSDHDVWATLWRGYLAYYETELPEEVYVSSFARLIDPQETNYKGFIAWNGDAALGLVHYIYHLHGWKIEPVCYLQDLFTVPEARGRGVGRALIEAVYKAADVDGSPNVYWLTQDFNAAGRKLYDKVGQLTPFIKYQRPSS